MWLIVGLGNPGPEHRNNRHNAGFMAVDEIVRRHGFSTPRKRFQGSVSEGRMSGQKVLALKPETFMNRSGPSVSEAARFYKIPPEQVIVFHDELDLAPGKLKVKSGGGHGGHNGIRSILAHFGAEFTRVRIGVGHPGNKGRVTGHVLGDFTKTDAEWLEPFLDAISSEAELLVAGDREGFLTNVARRIQPARNAGSRRNDAPSEKGGEVKEP